VTGEWGNSRHSAITATKILLELMESPDGDQSRLIVGYLDAKRQLARAFQALVVASGTGDGPFLAFATRLEMAAEAVYPRVPAKYRIVTGFGAAHRSLFGYLVEREGRDVPIEELRLLTRDAVHTERRIRELRDIGAVVTMSEAGGQRTCQIQIPVDLSAAAYQWISRKIDADDHLSEAAKDELRHVINTPS
jgi:hypothetical protein